MKHILKEIIIVLLLILAIILVLAIFLYDYIPMNKVVPQIEAYEVPNSIKEELKESVQDTQNTMAPIVYEINNEDLSIYEKAKDYQKGKVNPFGEIGNGGNTVNTNSNTVSKPEGNQNHTNTQDNNKTNEIEKNGSEGTYFPPKGTK